MKQTKNNSMKKNVRKQSHEEKWVKILKGNSEHKVSLFYPFSPSTSSRSRSDGIVSHDDVDEFLLRFLAQQIKEKNIVKGITFKNVQKICLLL